MTICQPSTVAKVTPASITRGIQLGIGLGLIKKAAGKDMGYVHQTKCGCPDHRRDQFYRRRVNFCFLNLLFERGFAVRSRL
jgi:hypothetical protein